MGSHYSHLTLDDRRLIFRLWEAKVGDPRDRPAARPTPFDDLPRSTAQLVRRCRGAADERLFPDRGAGCISAICYLRGTS